MARLITFYFLTALLIAPSFSYGMSCATIRSEREKALLLKGVMTTEQTTKEAEGAKQQPNDVAEKKALQKALDTEPDKDKAPNTSDEEKFLIIKARKPKARRGSMGITLPIQISPSLAPTVVGTPTQNTPVYSSSVPDSLGHRPSSSPFKRYFKPGTPQ